MKLGYFVIDVLRHVLCIYARIYEYSYLHIHACHFLGLWSLTLIVSNNLNLSLFGKRKLN